MNDLWKFLKQIPKGKITTYSILAKKLKLHPRAVGRMLNKNPDLRKIPCFKVIKSDGSLGGYKAGIKKKISLLRKDGIIIDNRKIDLKKILYKF